MGYTVLQEEHPMKKRIVISVAVAFLALAAPALFALSPKGEKDFPPYPGAARDLPGEEERQAQFTDDGAFDSSEIPERVLSRVIRQWTTADAPEKVYAFYLAKLAAAENAADAPAINSVKEGAVTSVRLRSFYWDSGETANDWYDEDGVKYIDGAWLRARFAERPRTPDGKWVKTARFSWDWRDGKNTMVRFTVTLTDESFVDFLSAYDQKTRVEFMAERKEFLTNDNLAAAKAGTISEETGKKLEKAKKDSPTEKALGVPIYPGAEYDTVMSADLSGGGYRFYAFRSADPSDKVARYYEGKTGKRATDTGDGSFMIPLSGPSTQPDDAIAIQSEEIEGGTPGSLIIIQKSGK